MAPSITKTATLAFSILLAAGIPSASAAGSGPGPLVPGRARLASFAAGLGLGLFLWGGDVAESIGLGWGTGVLVAGAVAAVLWAFGARWVPGWRHRAAAAGFTLALVGTVAWIAYSIATCRTCS